LFDTTRTKRVVVVVIGCVHNVLHGRHDRPLPTWRGLSGGGNAPGRIAGGGKSPGGEDDGCCGGSVSIGGQNYLRRGVVILAILSENAKTSRTHMNLLFSPPWVRMGCLPVDAAVKWRHRPHADTLT
jgi:hypothetical protein